MKKAVACLLLLAACGSEPAEPQPSTQRHDPMPLQNVRDARDTETTALFATMFRQIQVAVQRAPNREAYLRSLNGPLNAEKLQSFGMTEAQVVTSRFRLEHYSMEVAGNELRFKADNGTGRPVAAAHTLR